MEIINSLTTTVILWAILFTAYYFFKLTITEDYVYQYVFFDNLLLVGILILVNEGLLSKTDNLLIHITALIISICSVFYADFLLVKHIAKRENLCSAKEYAERYLQDYDIDPDAFKEKSYEEQLEIIMNSYIVNCDSGMAEYMVDDKDDLEDTLEILEPLLNRKNN